ncbi:hypothetical protein GCM10010168_63670 [Actinoplanes ianthinogenes]|uniref:Ricin B lectin domain-containing protein n=1 Tax=Actinoplanes ianthinogenes TaxID=122358 RepID=A0ABM7LJG1_9ACTN|nr:RICIN domain-containing protein [Actinoplanes ianthinogenes]BCJ39385.1 hypothetical protein Aiant_00420 [Actinoplanes ianthinogenes]GGR36495.1 hypothetical protein GCM10010168_63670 [Actinoplanes ianthinogenes]
MNVRQKIFAGLAAFAAAAAVILGSPGTASANPVTPNAVTFNQIRNLHSGKCVEVDRRGGVVQQFTCNGTVVQLWRKVALDNSGYFELVVAFSGQCMTVDNASQADGAGVHQQGCTGTFNQQWTTMPSGVPGWPFLVARHSGKALIIKSESLLDRASLVQDTIGDDGPDSLHAGDWQFQ